MKVWVQNQGNLAWAGPRTDLRFRRDFRRFGGGHPYEDRTDLPMTTVLATPVNIVIEWEVGDETTAGG